MKGENESSDGNGEPTVPQYQIQLENLDYELKLLKGKIFTLDQEHKREEIRIKTKLDAAKKAIIGPLKELKKLEDKESLVHSSCYDKQEEKQMEIKEIQEEKQKKIEKLNKIKEKLNDNYIEENNRYEKMLMLENDTYSTEIEKKKFEEEIPELETKTDTIVNTYPKEFKKLTDDFLLFDNKSRIEIKMKEIDDKISLLKIKVGEFEAKKKEMSKDIFKNEGEAGGLEIKLKMNEEKQKNIEDLVKKLTQDCKPILQIEKFFIMFDKYFSSKNYENDSVDIKIYKNIVIPFLDDILETYNNQNMEKLEIISIYNKQLEDLNDYKPLTSKIKEEIKVLKLKKKEESDFSNYLLKLINISKELKEKLTNLESPLNDEGQYEDEIKDKSIETYMFNSLKDMAVISSYEDKEQTQINFEDYLSKKEEKEKEFFLLTGNTKNSGSEGDKLKNECQKIFNNINRRISNIEELNKEKKQYQEQLKAINDTIKLREKELKTSLGKFKKEEFIKYFNYNKELIKLLLHKEKRVIIINNEYELTKEQIKENVLIDHSRKKMNIYNYLKRKYLLEYLCLLYSEENSDNTPLIERAQKTYEEITNEIQNNINAIEKENENINSLNNKINQKQLEKNSIYKESNPEIYELQDKIQNLQNNISAFESMKHQEESKYRNEKYQLEEKVSQLNQEIEALEKLLNDKLDDMTSGVVFMFLKENNSHKSYRPDIDTFKPALFGYSQRQFVFYPDREVLEIKDLRNNLTEKTIKFELIKKWRLDTGSAKLVESIETKPYVDENERKNDPNIKKNIKFFITLRKSNLDLVAKNYDDYKKFTDIINTIVIHK